MCHEVVSDGVIGVQTGSDTTWPATQVGPRTVKAGLGGQDDGVGGVVEVVENTLIPLRKLERVALLEHAAISDFNVRNKNSQMRFLFFDLSTLTIVCELHNYDPLPDFHVRIEISTLGFAMTITHFGEQHTAIEK